MYNKRQFHKANDKKILHKVKKQWVTISLALFLIIGGGAIATHVNADAKINTYTPAIKVSKAKSFNVNNTKAIQTKAKALHTNIIRLGASNNNNQAIQTGTYDGMNYKYSPREKNLEFTNGTLQNISDENAEIPNFLCKAPSELRHAISIKFNNDVKVNGNVTDIDFSNDAHLQSLILPKSFNTNNVSDMDFSSDPHLQSLILPENFSTNNVSDMSGMFANDTHLRSLTLPKSFNTNNVHDMSDMFINDNRLRSLALPKSFNTRYVLKMSGMFANDTHLRSLTLPESFNTNDVNDMDAMFQHDSCLRSLTLPKNFMIPKNIMSDSDVFSGDRSLTYLHISSSKTVFGKQSGLENRWRRIGTHHIINLANGKGHHVGTWIKTNKPIISKRTKRIIKIRKRRIERTGRKLLKLVNRDKKVLASKHAKHFNRLIKRIYSKSIRKSTKRALLRKIHHGANRKYLNVYKNLKRTNKLLDKGA